VEGCAAVDAYSKKIFDVTVVMDTNDDQIILDNLLGRLTKASPEAEEYIKQRFFSLDRPYAAHLIQLKTYLNYHYLLDNTNFNQPVMYSIREVSPSESKLP
jgi:hypothetical protein